MPRESVSLRQHMMLVFFIIMYSTNFSSSFFTRTCSYLFPLTASLAHVWIGPSFFLALDTSELSDEAFSCIVAGGGELDWGNENFKSRLIDLLEAKLTDRSSQFLSWLRSNIKHNQQILKKCDLRNIYLLLLFFFFFHSQGAISYRVLTVGGHGQGLG